ncbi:MAG: hypothetical protein V1816_10455 [Pseudomonadota bacterium]
MKRDIAFYQRLILACFTRKISEKLTLTEIKVDARQILSVREVEESIEEALAGLQTEGRVELIDPEQKLYRLVSLKPLGAA